MVAARARSPSPFLPHQPSLITLSNPPSYFMSPYIVNPPPSFPPLYLHQPNPSLSPFLTYFFLKSHSLPASLLQQPLLPFLIPAAIILDPWPRSPLIITCPQSFPHHICPSSLSFPHHRSSSFTPSLFSGLQHSPIITCFPSLPYRHLSSLTITCPPSLTSSSSPTCSSCFPRHSLGSLTINPCMLVS